MRQLGLLLLLIFNLLAFAAPASANGRVALVVGNDDYHTLSSLQGPRQDAEAMAVMLETIGYDVVRGINISKSRFRTVLTDFTRRLNAADVALFYYAGQGVQSEGRNYMLPIDAEVRSLTDLVFDAVPVMEVVRLMQRSAKSSVVLLECCSQNPFGGKGSSSLKLPGLAAETLGEGVFLAMAAQPGELTPPGAAFTNGLVANLKTPSADLSEVIASVEADVAAATGNKQKPWIQSGLKEPLAVNNAAPSAAPALTAAEPAAGAITQTANTAAAEVDNGEQAAWEKILDSSSIDDYLDFLAKYPNGVFASTAQSNIKRLQREAAARETAPKTTGQNSDPASTEPEPAQPAVDQVELARSTQEELVRVGCMVGPADGEWANISKNGLKTYAQHKGLKLVQSEPDEDLLERLRGEDGRVCPLECDTGRVEKNGQCVTITCPVGQKLSKNGACTKVPPKGEVVKAPPKVPPKKEVVKAPPKVEKSRPAPAKVAKQPVVVAPIGDGCPRGGKRARNGHCYFGPLCSQANKGLPGTDQCE